MVARVFVLKIVALLVLTTVLWPCAAAGYQENVAVGQSEVREEMGRSQYYLRLGTEDELQFHVHIWGQVHKPGLYLVADGTDVVGLISLAGGPADGAKLRDTKLVRTIPGNEGTIRVDLKRYTSSGDCSGIPILEPGDTVIVPATFWQGVTRFGTVLSVAALVANVIVYATR